MRPLPDAPDRSSAAVVPVSVPLLVLDVQSDGTLTARLDGQELAPPDGVEAWRRGMFGQIVDLATMERAFPVRVTVHESDGTRFTDILPAAHRPVVQPDPAPESARPSRRRGRPAALVEVDGGDGFIAGEDVAVALIIARTDATYEGHVRALLDPRTIAAVKAGEVVLVGRVSGAIAIRGLS
ncbi:hypothetical protein NQ038_03315 [Brevibacterium sp. 50QC2O2]|uniref:hypothetical protein n=1 Tax=Brevibacterium TaxID=1696 RepID=UPI00211C9409|nr:MULTISPECIES: hypothetical protein [unclassified Brevibacterium]MCQ9386038.1 hypothetical protein [Brevibacterium sp. 68QC2CO]MCQ9387671.1 hypothetical protein [Brevibacterium sp. 50QC2O2]